MSKTHWVVSILHFYVTFPFIVYGYVAVVKVTSLGMDILLNYIILNYDLETLFFQISENDFENNFMTLTVMTRIFFLQKKSRHSQHKYFLKFNQALQFYCSVFEGFHCRIMNHHFKAAVQLHRIVSFF